MSEKLYEYKKIRVKGSFHHLIRMQGEENWKHHRWEGPAIEPIEGEKSEVLSEREGLPWYKQSAPKGATYRN